jgi:hypothetical protein
VLLHSRPISIQSQYIDVVREHSFQTAMSDDNGCPAFLQHECQSLFRVGSIKRYIRMTGLENSEQSCNHIDRTLDKDANRDLRVQLFREQEMSNAICTLI